MTLFSWQCQNPCRLSLALIIDLRVVHNIHIPNQGSCNISGQFALTQLWILLITFPRILEIEAINWWDACAIHGISAMMSHCDIILHSLLQILASKVPNLQNREINIHTHIFSSPPSPAVLLIWLMTIFPFLTARHKKASKASNGFRI